MRTDVCGTIEIIRDRKTGRYRQVAHQAIRGTPRPGDHVRVIDEAGNTRLMTCQAFQRKYKQPVRHQKS